MAAFKVAVNCCVIVLPGLEADVAENVELELETFAAAGLEPAVLVSVFTWTAAWGFWS